MRQRLSIVTRPQFDLANFPVTETIKMITCLIEKIVKANDKLIHINKTPDQHLCFQANSIPTIDIHAYLTRIFKYCPCPNECFLSLLVYFDRMSSSPGIQQQQQHIPLRIDSYNIHRLTIVGMMIASKFFSDVFFTNVRYAKVGGLPLEELNALEIEVLKLNSFNMFVSLEELQKYGDQLLMHYRKEQSLKLNYHQMPIVPASTRTASVYRKRVSIYS
ncbi:cyclin-domain-containing protein [Mycotypha africana]|uniref:cyclin-domain-containing protein n=1 Tax=Mycotypha africana TaxID=64632 RepID=UPI002300BFB0|nr:cyclin-domain-containing protein [Mycotypha africana]KAI8972010.1 cyclin-domain-containing protein [Mycotypha africana]